MVGLWGMSDVIGPVTVITEEGQLPILGGERHLTQTQQLVVEEVRHLIDQAHEEVTQLMTTQGDQLEALAKRPVGA
jgi:cell division protease FtsH